VDRVVCQVAVTQLAEVALQLVRRELLKRIGLAGAQVPGHLLPVPLDRARAAAHHLELQQPLPHERLQTVVAGFSVPAGPRAVRRRRLLTAVDDPGPMRPHHARSAARIAEARAAPPAERGGHPHGLRKPRRSWALFQHLCSSSATPCRPVSRAAETTETGPDEATPIGGPSSPDQEPALAVGRHWLAEHEPVQLQRLGVGLQVLGLPATQNEITGPGLTAQVPRHWRALRPVSVADVTGGIR
jgi:hypothetical protein